MSTPVGGVELQIEELLHLVTELWEGGEKVEEYQGVREGDILLGPHPAIPGTGLSGRQDT